MHGHEVRPLIQIIQRAGRTGGGTTSGWSVVDPSAQRLDAGALAAAAEFAKTNGADSLLVIRRGQLACEHYWNGKTAADLQQTYSGTKSPFALLVGRSIERGYLTGLDQAVRELVPEMPEHQAQLTFRNVLAMESGMEYSPQIDALAQTGLSQLEIALQRGINAQPFARYHYNNAAYRLLFTALERAAGTDLETLTDREIFQPLSFCNACWVRLYAKKDADERFTGYQSVRMAPRDFAKTTQIIIDDGMWLGERFVPADFAKSLIKSPSPSVNPSFGLFHHLNAGAFYRDINAPEPPIAGRLVPGAPSDLFFMYGAGGQITAGIPSLGLVVVRTGQDRGASIYKPGNHFAQMLKMVAACVAN
jgi:CubicO group peptidase (beta-lactamase class C family)